MFTGNEIRNIEFEEVKRGYNQTDVKAFMRKIAEQIDELEQGKAAVEAERASLAEEKASIEQKMMVLADKIDDYRKDEDSLRAAILSAQRLSDTIVKEANENAEIIINDAQRKADELFGNTTGKIKKEQETLDKLKSEVSKFRSTVLNVYKSHLEVLSMIPETDEKEDADLAAEEPEIEQPASEPESADPVVAPTVFKADDSSWENMPASDIGSVENEEAPALEQHGVDVIENTFYAPPSSDAAGKDPFASFSPDVGTQPSVAEEALGELENASGIDAKRLVSEPTPESDVPSRFGQLDFGDGFSFTAK